MIRVKSEDSHMKEFWILMFSIAALQLNGEYHNGYTLVLIIVGVGLTSACIVEKLYKGGKRLFSQET